MWYILRFNVSPEHSDMTGFTGLVERLKAGENGSMAELYDYIRAGTRALLARQLEPQDFTDKQHEIFLEVLGAIRDGQIREPERLMGFVQTVARRKIAVYIGTAARNRRLLVEIGAAHPARCEDPEDGIISAEQRQIVRNALARLPEREREILERFYIHEQAPEQICAEMQLTGTQFRLLKWRSKARFEQLNRASASRDNLRLSVRSCSKAS